MTGTELCYCLETPGSLTPCHEFSVCLVGSSVVQMMGAGGWGVGRLSGREAAVLDLTKMNGDSTEDEEVMGTRGRGVTRLPRRL